MLTSKASWSTQPQVEDGWTWGHPALAATTAPQVQRQQQAGGFLLTSCARRRAALGTSKAGRPTRG